MCHMGTFLTGEIVLTVKGTKGKLTLEQKKYFKTIDPTTDIDRNHQRRPY